MLSLNPDETRAAYHAVAAFRRGRALGGHPIPPQIQSLYARLDTVIRCATSPARHGTDSGTEEFGAWIGTRLAAEMLGWRQRRVQRHAADLDGLLVGGRLVFPAAAVEAYRDALQPKGTDK